MKMIRPVALTLVLGTLFAGCVAGMGKPASFVQTMEPGWKSIELRKDLEYDKAWRTAVDTVGAKCDIEVLESAGGYLRTGWLYTWIQRGQVSQNYKTRITIKFSAGRDICQVKVDAQYLTDMGWITGYDSALLQEVYTDLQGKLGTVVR